MAIDGDVVVVGVPEFGTSNVGAAYVYYRLPDQGSGLGASWTRSTGASGAGRLRAASTDGGDTLSQPDRLGTSVALGNGRIVVGIPGFAELDFDYHTENTGVTLNQGDKVLFAVSYTGTFRPAGNSPIGKIYEYRGTTALTVTDWNSVNFSNETLWTLASNDAIRSDVAAVRTFAINSATPIASQIPAFSQAAMNAETLPDPLDATNATPELLSRFGQVSSYNPANRILAVANSHARVVYTYINEGLYWRPLPSVASPSTSTTSNEFGAALDQSGDKLMIGAPGEDKVYLYTFNATTETWSLLTTMTERNLARDSVLRSPSRGRSWSSACPTPRPRIRRPTRRSRATVWTWVWQTRATSRPVASERSAVRRSLI